MELRKSGSCRLKRRDSELWLKLKLNYSVLSYLLVDYECFMKTTAREIDNFIESNPSIQGFLFLSRLVNGSSGLRTSGLLASIMVKAPMQPLALASINA
jgi:hypothetical protein